MPIASESTSATLGLKGTEVRCCNMVLKTYDGKQKLKKCNYLMSVVELTVSGGSAEAVVHTKCGKCKQMVHHAISK